MKKRILNSILLTFLLLIPMLAAFSVLPVAADSPKPEVVTVKLEGPLNPIWKEILQRALDLGEADQAQAVIVELNTTGGSIDLMNQLINMIRTSPVPVVMYVSPESSMAASAGTLLVMAGHLSAMNPESIIGAASPVGSQGEDLSSTEDTKVKEALKGTARVLAADRGPQAVALAESAIEEARAATAQEAYDAGLVDFIAADLPDLLQQLDGHTLTINGQTLTLHTADAATVETPITAVENLLALLTNANIVFVLLAVGVQAILIEISSPGGWVAGFIGAVLLALAIYGLGLLPVNYVGLIFMAIAIVLFILDIKAPTHGALTAVGTGSFIAGALILFNSARVPRFANVSVGLVIGMGIFLGLSFFAVVLLAVRAMKAPIATGRETLAGKEGYAVTAIAPTGIVQVAGEQWSARLVDSQMEVHQGDRIEVDHVEGVKLVIRKKE
jgi:membrane-bound serine protease (ClpP class)